MIFAEKYGWQDIDDMPILERRRKLEIVGAVLDADKAAHNASMAKANRGIG